MHISDSNRSSGVQKTFSSGPKKLAGKKGKLSESIGKIKKQAAIAILQKGVKAGRAMKKASPGFVRGTMKRSVIQGSRIAPKERTISMVMSARVKTAFSRVSSFDVIPKLPFETPPVNADQMSGIQKMAESGDPKAQDLLRKLEDKTTIRDDFDAGDLEVLDEVNYGLVQQQMSDLNTLFNSGVFKEFEEGFEKQGVNYKEAVVAEVLSKALAYTGHCDGKTLQIPVKNGNKWQLEPFDIKKVRVGQEMPAYVLTSQSNREEPWVVFRGTEVLLGAEKSGANLREGNLESVAADLDKEGVGYTAFTSSMNSQEPGSLGQAMQMMGDKGFKVAGHSLGGTMASMLAKDSRASKAYSFSGTGFHPDKAKEFAGGDNCVHFHMRWDAVSSWGELDAGHNHIQISHPGNDTADPIKAHMRYDLIPKEGQTVVSEKVDVQKENAKAARKFSGLVTDLARKVAGKKIQKQMQKRRAALAEAQVESQITQIQNQVTQFGVE